ncbi:autotransporter outer membrane beta-barrel domain-containing protein [Pelistega sp. MC2]|uniref:autotransporter outer membrane beta-barrel domain-containing protein n=1 Tax=Pelistega sp. MC2 TaxID=1720297 RepID=UPI0008DAC2F6|nr:autotransporter outer membrane beta-barrel domain-containing protein [Pelistega sp. MC2]
MNKIYQSKYCAKTGTYVAVSELTQTKGKTKNSVFVQSLLALALGISGSSAWAAQCTTLTGWAGGTCEIYENLNYTSPVGWMSIISARGNTRAGAVKTVVKSATDASLGDFVAVSNTSSPRRADYGSTGFGVSTGSLTANDLSVKLTPESGKVVRVFGATAWRGGEITARNLNADVTFAREKTDIRGPIESYAVQVGTAIVGEDNLATATSKITVENADLKITNTAATTDQYTGSWAFLYHGRYQLSGIRVIRNEGLTGSNAIFESTGKVTINAFDSSTSNSGTYINGIYVSGVDNKVLLNDSDITIGKSGSDSAALKIGKLRQTGTGGSDIVSKGNMVLDTTAESKAVTVRLLGDNSQLIANADTSSGVFKSAGIAIDYSSTDVVASAASQNQKVLLKNTQITTLDESNGTKNVLPLINVNAGTASKTTTALFELSGDNSSAKASNYGWLIDVKKNATLMVNNTDKGSMTGLTNIALNSTGNAPDVSQLTANLDNGFTWNLNKKQAGDSTPESTTATLTNLNLNNQAVLNGAYDATGNNNYTVKTLLADGSKGLVNSDNGIVTLKNAQDTDKLTIDGNYNGINKASLVLDTQLNDDSTDVGGSSKTDFLHITGDSTGQTEVEVNNTTGLGAHTQKGIRVIQVDGTSTGSTDQTFNTGSFVLKQNPNLRGIFQNARLVSTGGADKQKWGYGLFYGSQAPVQFVDWQTKRTVLNGNAIPAGIALTPEEEKSWFLRNIGCVDGSHTVSGGSSAAEDGLGCITPDIITVDTGASVTAHAGVNDAGNVEGAGDSDTITIKGSVAGGVYGGNDGLDDSAAEDTGDKILITDGATVGGVVNGQKGDDEITINQTATVAGNVLGEDGDDTVEWADSSSIGGMNLGIGSDLANVSSTKYSGNQTLLLDGGDDTLSSDGWVDTLNLNNVKVATNGDKLKNWEIINLNGSTALDLSGDLVTGKEKGVTFRGATVNSGLTIGTEAILATKGNVNITGDVYNNNIIDMNKDSTLRHATLAINGDYVAGAKALLKMNTLWNAPGDIEIEGGNDSVSDVLHIKGKASGITKVIPIAANGTENFIDGNVDLATATTASKTVTNEDASIAYPNATLIGIKTTTKTTINTLPVVIVDQGNQAGQANFIGMADTAGAGEVLLTYQDKSSGVRNYYWTTTLEDTETNYQWVPLEPGVVTPPVKPPVEPPVTPKPPVEPPVKPKPVPIYKHPVSGVVQMPQVNMEQGFAAIGTLHERRGDGATMAWDSCGCIAENAKGQVWGRMFGKHLELDGRKRFNLEQNTYGFQFGHDFNLTYNPDTKARTSTGAFLTYAHTDAKFYDEYRFDRERYEQGLGIGVAADKLTGRGKSDTVSLGVSHTRYAKNGSYVDLVGNLSYIHNKYKPRYADSVGQNGYGVALSAEAGRPWAINDTNWVIEPQAQLMYQMLHLNSFKMDKSTTVDSGNYHALRGRIGARLTHYSDANKDKYTETAYLTANIYHDFISPKSVRIGTDNIREKYNRTWWEVGAGVQLPVTTKTQVYGDVRYEHSFGGAKRAGYKGSIGVKYSWK